MKKNLVEKSCILETQRSQGVSSRQTDAAVQESTLKSAEKKGLDPVLSILQKMETRLTAAEQKRGCINSYFFSYTKGFSRHMLQV